MNLLFKLLCFIVLVISQLSVLAQENNNKAVFQEYLRLGEFNHFTVREGDSIINYLYGDKFEFGEMPLRGDTLVLFWHLDSICHADGNLHQAKRLKKFTMVKEGRSHAFLKQENGKVSMAYRGKFRDPDYLGFLRNWVIFYIAYSNQDLIKQNVKDMNITWIFHIDDVKKKNINYTRLQLVVQEIQGNARTVQWLYVNPENRQLYEYDVAKNKLLLFK
ncbi:hypothetical protein [Sphingobacterium kyonggiense]